MITVTVNIIDGKYVPTDIRCIDIKMISAGSIRPLIVNNPNSFCVLDVLTWDGNISNFRASRWTLAETFETIRKKLNLVTVTLLEINGTSVSTDIRAINQDMMVAGSMRPSVVNTIKSNAIFNVLKWDNNTFNYISQEWMVGMFYEDLLELLLKLNNPPYGVASGTNTYTVNLAPDITSYEVGVPIYVKFPNNNSAGSTLNCNGIGVVEIRYKGAILDKNIIIANEIYMLIYDGGAFQIRP